MGLSIHAWTEVHHVAHRYTMETVLRNTLRTDVLRPEHPNTLFESKKMLKLQCFSRPSSQRQEDPNAEKTKDGHGFWEGLCGGYPTRPARY